MIQTLKKDVRFFKNVEITAGCWNWTGKKYRGYGTFWAGGGSGSKPYRYAVIMSGRRIPKGFQVDHLCKNPSCVNPAHLEPVTPYENWLRSDAPSRIAFSADSCKNGHPRTPKNTGTYGVSRSGNILKRCRVCAKLIRRRYVQRKKSLAPAIQ